MVLIGEPTPVTTRRGDKEWPSTMEIVAGKDNEGFVHKSMVMSRYTSLTTAFFSVSDIILMPHKNPGIATAVSRISWWGIPLIGGGLVYTSTVNLLSNLRGGKTDELNHFGGGVAVGTLLGKHSRSILTGFVMGSLLGIWSYAYKTFEMREMDVWSFPENKRIGGPFAHKHDYTVTYDRPGYWARSEEEAVEVQKRGMYGPLH